MQSVLERNDLDELMAMVRARVVAAPVLSVQVLTRTTPALLPPSLLHTNKQTRRSWLTVTSPRSATNPSSSTAQHTTRWRQRSRQPCAQRRRHAQVRGRRRGVRVPTPRHTGCCCAAGGHSSSSWHLRHLNAEAQLLVSHALTLCTPPPCCCPHQHT
jgi:hypothetical protein